MMGFRNFEKSKDTISSCRAQADAMAPEVLEEVDQLRTRKGMCEGARQ